MRPTLDRKSLGSYTTATLQADERPLHKTTIHWIVLTGPILVSLFSLVIIGPIGMIAFERPILGLVAVGDSGGDHSFRGALHEDERACHHRSARAHQSRVLNGIGNPLWTLQQRAYTPGVATAPVLLVLTLSLLWQLKKRRGRV